MYCPRLPSRSEWAPIRHHRYHLRHWGTPQPDTPPLLMLHGWMDVSASFQFVVDALVRPRHIIAPDWRGFGLTRPQNTDPHGPRPWGHGDHYLFADYLADLDFVLDHLNAQLGRNADAPFDLVGHSMGGNVVMAYAGIRPQRVRRAVNLEGFGLPATRPVQAPRQYARWLNDLKALHQGDKTLRPYPNADGVARRLMKTNPRLHPDRAAWLARHWAAPDANGQWHILGDPAHKTRSAHLYRADETLALYQHITAPVLAIEAGTDSLRHWYPHGEYTLADYHTRLQTVPNCRTAVVADAGHMLHHDQPAAVATLIETHLQP